MEVTEDNNDGDQVESKSHFVNTYDQFLLKLQETEVSTYSKFVCRRACKQFTAEKVVLEDKQRLSWQNGTPYIHIGRKTFECHQGRDYNLKKKKKYAAERDAKACNDHNFTKRYNKTQMTKKLDCPASITVSRVVRFTEFKLSEPASRHRKVLTSKKIWELISNDTNIGEEGFYFNLPSAEDHKNHLSGTASSVVEPIDARVREKISNLVKRGERNPLVVLKLVQSYVENELQEFDKTRRRFYPDKSSVREIITRTKMNLKESPIDQENAKKVIDKWDKTKHNVHFRPYTKDDPSCDGESQQDEGRIIKKNLLFVYQSQEMSDLYRKYGQNCVLLDATYKTCKYSIPLYFVVVETNVNYQVVGVLVTQFETAEDITEGLEIFRSWNEDINPKYAMVDFAAEEINSLEAVFPGIEVFICSFHREQAWSRWMTKSSNSAIPKKEALMLLRAVANAPTEDELMMAIDRLKKWNHYESSPLKGYFSGTWEKELNRWATAYKPVDMFLNTNNGVERLNRELKYNYLIGLKGCSLSELLEVVCLQFLPERFKVYVRENLKISPLCRKYDERVPQYLHGRPKWLIDHVMKKLENTHDSNVVTQLCKEGHFVVSSSTTNKRYNVVFEEEEKNCSCDCADFRRERLVCKHILRVGQYFPNWSLKHTHSWIFENPIFQVDASVLPQDILNNNGLAFEPTLQTLKELNEENQIAPLKLRGSKKRHIINDCRALLRSIESAMWNLKEDHLEDLKSTLKVTFDNVSSQVEVDDISGLPMDKAVRPLKVCVSSCGPSGPIGNTSFSPPLVNLLTTNLQQSTFKSLRYETDSSSSIPGPSGPIGNARSSPVDYGKLQVNKKRGFSGRVGCNADMMKLAGEISVLNTKPQIKRLKRM